MGGRARRVRRARAGGAAAARTRAVLAVVAVGAAIAAATLSPPGRAVVERGAAHDRDRGRTAGALPAPVARPRCSSAAPAARGSWPPTARSGGSATSARRRGRRTRCTSSRATPQRARRGRAATARVHWRWRGATIALPALGRHAARTRASRTSPTSRLHVVAGDGTGDRRLPRAARVAPAWQPGTSRHVLAYVDVARPLHDPRARIRHASSRMSGRYRGRARHHVVAGRADARARGASEGRALLGRDRQRARSSAVAGVRAVAFAPDGRLAIVRGNGVLLLAGARVRTLFVPPQPARRHHVVAGRPLAPRLAPRSRPVGLRADARRAARARGLAHPPAVRRRARA